MQKLKNKVIVTIIAVILLITGIFGVSSMQSKNSYALLSNYKESSNYDTIYYFSDSPPDFEDLAKDMAGDYYKVRMDVKKLITEQEFAFLLYSGYFWGFNQSYKNITIIELKTMQPDRLLLENLFACLKAQGCSVMFITPYKYIYGSLSNCDTVMPCNKDQYSLYIKESISKMSGEYGYVRNNTLLLLDGRFAGINYYFDNCDLSRLYYKTETMRRILCYMYYGWNADGSDFEEPLYENIWSLYMENVMYDYGFDLNYFNGDTDIYEYIEMWETLQEYDPDFEEHFRQENLTECDEYTDWYYSEIAKSLAERNIHILVHVDGDMYVDLFEDEEYHFQRNEAKKFLDTISDWGIEYLYEMGIWYLKGDLYVLLTDIHKIIKEGGTSFALNPLFTWEEQPIIWSDHGPIVISDTMMRGEAGEVDEYTEEELKEKFEEELEDLLSD